MSALNQWSLLMAETVGWTLLLMVWIGAVIGLMVFVIRRFGVSHQPVVRYWTAMGAMLSMLVLGVFLFIYYWISLSAGIHVASESETIWLNPTTTEPLDTSMLHVVTKETAWISYLPWLSVLWCAGVFVLCIRLWLGFRQIQALRKLCEALPLGVSEIWGTLLAKNGVQKRIQCAVSSKIKSPLTFGYWQPVVLLPIGLINQLSMEETEAVLAHELAHVLRHDYVFQWLQCLVEVLFYFHPVVWWLSKIIREEREQCADALALQLYNQPLHYAKALLSTAQWSQSNTPRLAMGMSANKPLLQRIQYILQPTNKKNTSMEKLTISMAIVGLCALCAFNAPLPQSSFAIQKMDTLEQDSIPKTETVKRMMIMDDEGREFELEYTNGVLTEFLLDDKPVPDNKKMQYLEELEPYMSAEDNDMDMDIQMEEMELQQEAEQEAKEDRNERRREIRIEKQIEIEERRHDSETRRHETQMEREQAIEDQRIDRENAIEDERVARQIAQQDAEYARRDAEMARKEAELARNEAELARKEAELARTEAQMQRKSNKGKMKTVAPVAPVAPVPPTPPTTDGNVSAKTIVELLKKENHIKDVDNFSIKFTDKALSVDGKTLSEDVYKRTKSAYESSCGCKLGSSFGINIKEKKD